MKLKNRFLAVLSAMSMLGVANADTLTYTGVTVASGAIDGNDLTGQTATISITFADGLTASGGVYSLGVISAASYEFSGAGLFTVDAPQNNLEFGSPQGFDVSFFDEDFNPLAMLSGTTAGSAGMAPLDGETLAAMFARLGDGTNIAFTQSTDFQMLNSVIGTLNGGASSITGNITGQISSTVTLTLIPSNDTVIDFQALEHVDGNTTNHGTTYSEDGFTLNGPSLTTFGTLEDRYPGSTAIFSNANTGLIEVVQDNGGTYSAQTVDLVPLNNGGSPTTVVFNGELGGVNVANQSFTTNSIGFVLETFTFNSDFANIDRLTWTQDSPFNQVDNIRVSEASDPGCPADLDGDGDADADDFFGYLDAFAGGNLAVCDIDGDGDCDADDFFGYLDLFAQGC